MPKFDIANPEAIDIAAIEAELRPQSTEKLREHFAGCFGGAARLIAEASVCVKLMKERGENLTGVPMVATFLRVAEGQVDANLIWKFIESPNRQLVARLPLSDQKRLAADPLVPVIEPKPEGGYTKRFIDLTGAPAEVARLVVGPDGIRSPEEQMAFIGSQNARQAIGRASVADEPVGEPLSRQITVRLTASEDRDLKIEAAKNGVSLAEQARRFVLRGMAKAKGK